MAQQVDNTAPAGPGIKVIYNIEIDLPEDIGMMAIINDQLAANEGAFVVEDVDKEAEFEDTEEVDTDEVYAPPPPPIPLPAAADNNAWYP